MTEKLNRQSVQGWLEKRPGWKAKRDCLVKEFQFKSFRDTIVFVNRIASLADELGTCERTVRKYLRQLEDNGDIETVKGEKFGSQRENVYILGKVESDGTEVLYHTVQK